MQNLSISPSLVRRVSRADAQLVKTGQKLGSDSEMFPNEPRSKEMFMLSATVQEFGDTTVVRCQGRIVIGDAYTILHNAALSQTLTRMLVLDLAQVDRIDAGGLGVLLRLRKWAHSNAIRLRLMNVMNKVEQVFELTTLDRVFEFCSVRDMFHLLHAAAMAPWSVDQGNQ